MGGTIARSIVPLGLFNFRSRVPFVPRDEPALFWRLGARGWGLEKASKNAGLKHPALRLNLRPPRDWRSQRMPASIRGAETAAEKPHP